MTTEVSRIPRVGSVIEALVYQRIEVCAELCGVDTGCAGYCLGERCPEHEAPWLYGSQLRNRRAVTGYDDRAASLYFAKYSRRLIAELTLCDDSGHLATVALVAPCSISYLT